MTIKNEVGDGARCRVPHNLISSLRLQAELVTQVHFLDQLVGQDGFGVAFGNQLSIVDDVSGFADIQRLTHVVVGDQHADPFGLEVVNDLLDVAYGNRVDTGEGFV